MLVGEGIASALEFIDNYHDEIPNYVYNVDPTRYDRILIGYETQPLPASHQLAKQLGATPLFFEGLGSVNVYAFLDLDDTLFQTLPKCPPGCAAPARRLPQRRRAAVVHDRPASAAPGSARSASRP